MKTRNILWYIFAMIVMLGLSGFLPEQKKDVQQAFQRSPETRANVISTMMKNRLDLSEVQVEKAYQINLNYAKKLQLFWASTNYLPEISDEMAEINADRKKELLAILTPKQREQADQIRRKWIDRLESTLERLKENDSIKK